MASEVIMPALGVAQETGRVLRWNVAEGQAVEAGDELLEIETDKVTVAIEAPASGVLAGLRASEGEDVPVGTVIAFIVAPGEEPPDADGTAAGADDSPAAPGVAAAHASDAAIASKRTSLGAGPNGGGGRKPASPLARRKARQRGLDLSLIQGSGPGGAVLASDVAGAAPGEGREGTPASEGPLWLRMVERTVASWSNAPHFYLLREVRADRLAAWRDELKARLPALTVTDLLVKAVAAALRRHSEANATFEGGRIVRHAEIDVGLAVAVDEGLVVPVIRGADRLTVEEIATRRKDLTERSRAGCLRPADVGGGTFTVSNLGTHGVDAFMAIVNPPQAAVLSVGRMAPRVVAEDGRPVVRQTLTLGLSCDHRVLDGARAAQFLETLASMVEEPARLES